MTTDYTDITIAGGGLTGCALAALLAKQGIACTLIDGQAITVDKRHVRQDPRALSITPATQRILSSINAWQLIPVDRIGRFEKIHVWDGRSGGDITFESNEICEPVLGYIVEQAVLQEALNNLVLSNPYVNVISENTIDSYIQKDHRVICELSNGEHVETRLLVAADGANSGIRKLAGLALDQIDYHQKAVACIVESAVPHDETAWQRFLSTGPVALLPMRGPNRCGVVWSNQSEAADELLQLNDREFCKELEAAFDYRFGEIKGCGPRAGFGLYRSQVTNYFTGSCVMVGDAAHTVHPLAGQGANMGMADIAVLFQLIADTKSLNRNFSSKQVLRRYERWRKTENRKMTIILDGIKNLFEMDGEVIADIREKGMQMVNSSSFIKNRIMKYAMGIEGDIPRIVRRSIIQDIN